jgi:WD40 repeat protein
VCEFGGAGSIEMLFRSNLFAIVGGGDFPCFSPEKVLIWDDHQCKWIGELGFHSKVLGIRLRRDKIVVALKNKIFIYNFEDLKQLQQLESVDNPKGLCALSSQQDRTVLVCPGLQPGQIRVEHLDHRRSNFINNAHASDLACLALSLDGTLLASASEKGTLIRIWRTTPNQDGSSSSSSSSSFGIIVPRTSGGAGTNSSFLEQELRRGSDRAEIYSIAFSPSKSWLAATSNKGTVHIWPLQSNEDASASAYGNEVSSPSRVIPTWASRLTNNFVPSYFHSKWSLAQYRLGDDSRSEVTFGTKENTLIVITCSGKFHKVQFDIQGGECKKISFCKFA